MKLQTTETKSKITIINIILLIIFVTSVVFSYIDIERLKEIDKLIVFTSFLALLYLSYLGCPFFRYDSDGETLIFQNQKGLPFSPFIRETQSDFPKNKLANYNISKRCLFKRKLEIYIISKRVSTGLSKLSFDVSYLNTKQIRDLNISLSKVVKENEQYIRNKKIEHQITG